MSGQSWLVKPYGWLGTEACVQGVQRPSKPGFELCVPSNWLLFCLGSCVCCPPGLAY